MQHVMLLLHQVTSGCALAEDLQQHQLSSLQIDLTSMRSSVPNSSCTRWAAGWRLWRMGASPAGRGSALSSMQLCIHQAVDGHVLSQGNHGQTSSLEWTLMGRPGRAHQLRHVKLPDSCMGEVGSSEVSILSSM